MPPPLSVLPHHSYRLGRGGGGVGGGGGEGGCPLHQEALMAQQEASPWGRGRRAFSPRPGGGDTTLRRVLRWQGLTWIAEL